MKIKHILCSAAIAAMAFSAPAAAVTQTATMNITANSIAVVSVSATDLNFGDMILGGSIARASSTITVNATNTAAYTVAIDAGQNGGGAGSRAMASGTDRLGYRLYTDTGATTFWGDGTAATGPAPAVAGTGNGADQVLTVFGETNSGTAALGSFSDTITVTVAY